MHHLKSGEGWLADWPPHRGALHNARGLSARVLIYIFGKLTDCDYILIFYGPNFQRGDKPDATVVGILLKMARQLLNSIVIY